MTITEYLSSVNWLQRVEITPLTPDLFHFLIDSLLQFIVYIFLALLTMNLSMSHAYIIFTYQTYFIINQQNSCLLVDKTIE